MGNIVQFYYKLEPGAVEITAVYNDQLPAVKTMYINGDQIFHSETDTYAADRTRKKKRVSTGFHQTQQWHPYLARTR